MIRLLGIGFRAILDKIEIGWLARKLGKKDPRSIRIELRISHQELSEMVGTTRPRISVFMQRFRNLGLIEMSAEHHLIIKESKLTAYLGSIA